MKLYKKIGTTLGLLGALALGYINPSYADEIKEKPKVAVLDFEYNTKERPKIENMIMTGLGKADCIELYERGNLKKILEEMKINESGVIDQNTAIEVGKLAGVEKIVLGSYNVVDDQVSIDVRYIDVKTGKVEKTEGVIGNRKDLSLANTLTEKLNYSLCGNVKNDDSEEEDLMNLKPGIQRPPTHMGGGMTLSDEELELLMEDEEIIEDSNDLCSVGYDPNSKTYELRGKRYLDKRNCDPEFLREHFSKGDEPEVKLTEEEEEKFWESYEIKEQTLDLRSVNYDVSRNSYSFMENGEKIELVEFENCLESWQNDSMYNMITYKLENRTIKEPISKETHETILKKIPALSSFTCKTEGNEKLVNLSVDEFGQLLRYTSSYSSTDVYFDKNEPFNKMNFDLTDKSNLIKLYDFIEMDNIKNTTKFGEPIRSIQIKFDLDDFYKTLMRYGRDYNEVTEDFPTKGWDSYDGCPEGYDL